jgi:serpin B
MIQNQANIMKLFTTYLTMSIFCCAAASALQPSAAPASREWNPDFAPALYQKLKADAGNVFFSPHGITEAMVMAGAGAGGKTAREITRGLALDQGSAEDIAAHGQALRTQIAKLNQGDNKLTIANALCIIGANPTAEYQKLVRSQYNAEVFPGDVAQINGWVKEKTEGCITEIIDELGPDNACVLLNAVYFKGNWKTPFTDDGTHDASFHPKPGQSVIVNMMKSENSYPLLQDMGIIAVELPYQNSASMVLVMPEKADGMDALENQLDAPFLAGICDKLGKREPSHIELRVPKFKVATSYDLVPSLQQLGMIDAFDMDRADFTPMFGKKGFKIGQIVHKATLEVAEKGSVASAATAAAFLSEESSNNTPEIRFDRPFLVIIRDNATGTLLFMGRINDPSSK